MKAIHFTQVLLLALLLQGCLRDEFQELDTIVPAPEKPYSDFSFNVVSEYNITIKVLNSQNKPISAAILEVYQNNPFDGNGLLIGSYSKYLLFKGITNNDGTMSFTTNIPTITKKVYIVSKTIGVNEITEADLIGSSTTIVIGGSKIKSARLKSMGSPIPSVSKVNGFYTLGTWSNLGVPNYLEYYDDEVDNALLADINATLPERVRLTESHPQYLLDNNDGNLSLTEDAEVWVTFVHEGAGWLNVLGYYSYPTNTPPLSKSSIRDLSVIFPNVSYSNSGGGLASGNKVKLYYLDPATNEYTSIFPAGTSIGWFIIAQGWSSSTKTVTPGSYTHYSNYYLNSETDATKKRHNVLLYDSQRELLLLAFEDMNRDVNKGSDEDFNDALFYATVSPSTAVDIADYKPLDTPTDSDNDGVSDVFDEMPTIAQTAFNNYYPSPNTMGTLVFEDLWPYKGDYDFNDLVLDYQFNTLTNSDNLVTEIKAKILVKAIGASYHNGFGISINTAPSNIASVSGQRLTQNLVTVNSNGTEANQSKATIIVFDDAFNALPYPGTGLCVNTYEENPYVNPDTLFLTIKLVNPISLTSIGSAPFNPFLIVNQDRSVEIHLPNKEPTNLADITKFGQGQDNSSVSQKKYYLSDNSLPWAANFPESFTYPKEKESIIDGYNLFNSWAESRGYNYMDWYQEKSGYRNNSKLYTKKSN